jgi:hypothetical protein
MKFWIVKPLFGPSFDARGASGRCFASPNDSIAINTYGKPPAPDGGANLTPRAGAYNVRRPFGAVL